MKNLRERAPRIIGRAAYLVGIIDILANVLRPFKASAEKIDTYLPLIANSTAFATAVFTGIILIIVARGLIRRKKRAWGITVAVLIINLASDLFRSRSHPLQLGIVAALLLVLLIFRNEFYAVSDPSTKFQPFRAFLIGLIAVIVAGIFILYFRHSSQIVGNPSFANIILTVLEGLLGISGPVEFTSEAISNTFDITLLLLGIGTLIIPLWLFFRHVEEIKTMTQDELLLIKELLNQDGESDSLGYFATRRDKSVVWSANKKAGIAYRIQGGVMLASGDPFGEFSLWPEVIENFLQIAKAHAWTPAVMGAGDRGGEVWVERAGMLAIEIGDEAIINVADFSLEGRPISNVRQMVNRVKRKGYDSYTSKFVELPTRTQNDLHRLAKLWRYGAPERGFSMSMDRFADSVDDQTYITVATLENQIVGLLYFVPWGGHKLSLDRMQRSKDSELGINELMIVGTTLWAKENGFTHISLNFAAFRSLFERANKISAGPITRGTRNIISFFSNWFQVESLYRFNAKFQPEWQPRYVIYPRASELVKVGIAAIKAEKFVQSFRSRSA
jgi:lysyl-tRNA synthetase class 2